MVIMNVLLAYWIGIVDGQAPAKVIAKVNEWINLHEAEILSLWEKAQKGEKIDKIEPLK